MRSTDIRIGSLILGAALLLAAALAPRIFSGALRIANSGLARIAAAVAGAVLFCWGLSAFLTRPPNTQAAAPILHVAPVDLVDAASIALQDCARPVPPSIPDGTRASGAEMTAARTAFQEYDKATNAYAHCVDEGIERIRKQYETVAAPAQLNSLKAFGIGAHDTAIDQEQAVADHFNAQVRAYRAAHPQS